MPEGPTILHMPLDRQQGAIGQLGPGTKRPSLSRNGEAEPRQQSPHMGCLGPEATVLRGDAQGRSRGRRNTAAGSFFLSYRLHERSNFIFRPPEMLNPCRS